MRGTSAIGCISDADPQPLLIRSNLGTYAICMTGVINNAEELIDQYLSFSGGHFDSMTGGRINQTELLSALINQKSNFAEGIRFAQKSIVGTASILILTDKGSIIAARDRMGRLPVSVGKREDSYAVAFESFAYHKTGYEDVCELGPGEIVELTPTKMTQLVAPGKKKKICSFLWSYYGYPTSCYEGVNVEEMRYRNGAIMADNDKAAGRDDPIDYIGGVPDSGTPHAIGYANRSGTPFARAFIKYTPTWSRSFMPANQTDRDKIAKMKQIPVNALIKDKNLLFVDDSIVRGTLPADHVRLQIPELLPLQQRPGADRPPGDPGAGRGGRLQAHRRVCGRKHRTGQEPAGLHLQEVQFRLPGVPDAGRCH